MAEKTPREEASPQEELDYNDTDVEEDAANEAKERAPRQVSPHKIDHGVVRGNKGPTYAPATEGLQSRHERLARATAAGKQPGCGGQFGSR